MIILMKQSWQGIVQDQLHQGMQRSLFLHQAPVDQNYSTHMLNWPLLAYHKLVDDAAQLEYSLEQELHSHRLIGKSNPSLAALYQVMLDLPAADGLAQGVYFAIQFQMGRQMVSHFFEGGSFSGFHYAKGLPPIMAHHQERQVNSYRVFTDADLFRRQHFLASRSSSISAKRYGKDSTGKT
uniref:Uncharacterized protein n=1 Tax=Capitella teleta TaxID=283909 RepID=X1ZYX7_CAPTE